MTRDIDDRTTAYVIAAQPLFEDLRQVAAQLAGLLVLAATGAASATPDHPMLEASQRVFARAADALQRTAPSSHERTRSHHRQLRDASDALARALAAAHGWPLHVDAVMIALREAYRHLQRAASDLPGFEMVSFEHACANPKRGA